MIKLERPPRPTELTDEIIKIKTEIFNRDKEQAVWKEKYIEEALKDMSHNKCCYCECSLNNPGVYMEIDHFHDKKDYPNEVVFWENLLPSCKTCNSKKSTHDTLKEPIINPSIDDPRDSLVMCNCVRFRGCDAKGRLTIEVLDLNNTERQCNIRYQIGNEIKKQIEEVYNSLCDYDNGIKQKMPQGMGRLRNKVLALFEKGLPNNPYAGTIATVITTDSLIEDIRQKMEESSIWTDEINDTYKTLSSISFKNN